MSGKSAVGDFCPMNLRELDLAAATCGRTGPDAPADLELLSAPPDVTGIEMREISTLVNNVRNNGPELLEPAEPQPEQATLL